MSKNVALADKQMTKVTASKESLDIQLQNKLFRLHAGKVCMLSFSKFMLGIPVSNSLDPDQAHHFVKLFEKVFSRWQVASIWQRYAYVLSSIFNSCLLAAKFVIW